MSEPAPEHDARARAFLRDNGVICVGHERCGGGPISTGVPSCACGRIIGALGAAFTEDAREAARLNAALGAVLDKLKLIRLLTGTAARQTHKELIESARSASVYARDAIAEIDAARAPAVAAVVVKPSVPVVDEVARLSAELEQVRGLLSCAGIGLALACENAVDRATLESLWIDPHGLRSDIARVLGRDPLHLDDPQEAAAAPASEPA